MGCFVCRHAVRQGASIARSVVHCFPQRASDSWCLVPQRLATRPARSGPRPLRRMDSGSPLCPLCVAQGLITVTEAIRQARMPTPQRLRKYDDSELHNAHPVRPQPRAPAALRQAICGPVESAVRSRSPSDPGGLSMSYVAALRRLSAIAENASARRRTVSGPGSGIFR